MTDRYRVGDVFWAPDPYNDGAKPRPWLVLAADSLPYAGEEYVCAGLTSSNLDGNLEVGDDWVVGSNPEKTSYCSPWVLATIKHDAVVGSQGAISDAFVNAVVRQSAGYLAANTELALTDG